MIGPGLPVPIFLLSTSLTGVISAAVPERNISSAMYNSSLVNLLSFIEILLSSAILKTQSLVIPSSIDVTGVVLILPFL